MPVVADPAQALLALLLGYAALLAIPGPNMLAIGGMAATRGFARTVPICLGLVAGATSLACAAGLLAAVGDVASAGVGDLAGRVLGAALLAWVALAQIRAGDTGHREGAAGRGVAFCAGFCTAATNPLTAAFFAAHLAANPLGAASGWVLPAAALFGVAAMALGCYLGMAVLLANPVARRAALSWQRPLRLASGAALLLSAAAMLRPVLLR